MRRYPLIPLFILCAALAAPAAEIDPAILAIAERQRETIARYQALSYTATEYAVEADSGVFTPSPTTISITRRGDTILLTHEMTQRNISREIRENGKVVGTEDYVVHKPQRRAMLVTTEFLCSWPDADVPYAQIDYAKVPGKPGQFETGNPLAYVHGVEPLRHCLGLDQPLSEQLAYHPELTTWSIRTLENGDHEVTRVLRVEPNKIALTVVQVFAAEHGLLKSATAQSQRTTTTSTIEYTAPAGNEASMPMPARLHYIGKDAEGTTVLESNVTYTNPRDESGAAPFALPDLGLPAEAELVSSSHPSGHQYFVWRGGILEPIPQLSKDWRAIGASEGPTANPTKATKAP